MEEDNVLLGKSGVDFQPEELGSLRPAMVTKIIGLLLGDVQGYIVAQSACSTVE